MRSRGRGDSLDDLQRKVLEEMNAFAQFYPAIKALYLFGSVARGDYRRESDIDLCIEWAEGFQTEHGLMISYIDFQPEGLKWGNKLAARLGRPVNFHRHNIDVLDDEAWSAVQEGAKSPLARVGKALMVWTPPKP